MTQKIPVVALIGLPNSGKSTLLNKLTGSKNAIVAKEAHTTRDLNRGEDIWEGMLINFIDTGGLVPKPEDKIQKEVQVRSWAGIQEADLLVWVIDRKQDPETIPLSIMQSVWKTGKDFIICINKVDNPNLDKDFAEYAKLGSSDFINISAQNSYNLGGLMDILVEKLLKMGFEKPKLDVSETRVVKKKKKKAKQVERTKEGYYIVRDQDGLFNSATESELTGLATHPTEFTDSNSKGLIKNLILDFGGVLFQEKSIAVENFLQTQYNLQNGIDYNGFDLWAKVLVENQDFSSLEFWQKWVSYLPLEVDFKEVYKFFRESVEVEQKLVNFLQYLKSQDYNLFYLTNIRPSTEWLLEQRLGQDFMYIFDGGLSNRDLGYESAKPEPEIFLELTKRYSLDSRQSLFIDDKKENIETAKELGFKTYWFDNKNNFIDDIAELLEVGKQDIKIPKVLFLGKPNVGKSSLFNTMLGSESQIVTEIAGTTLSVSEQLLERKLENSIQAVIFDFYGVVFVDDDQQGIMDYLVDNFGVDREDGAFREMLKMLKDKSLSREEFLQILDKQYNFQIPSWEVFYNHCQEEIQTNLEVSEFIKNLKEQGIDCYYLTNIDNSLEHRQKDPIFKEFKGGVASCEVGIEKPDPKIYQLLINKYNLKPNQTLFIDDKKENLEGARKVGLKTMWYQSGEVDIDLEFRKQKAWLDFRSSRKYKVLDSVGVRKPGQRTFGAESFATYRTIQTAYEADVICLVLDGSVPVSHQDQVVAGIAKEAKKGIVVIANKADLVDDKQKKTWGRRLEYKFQFLKNAPIVWTSAKESLGLDEVWSQIDKSLLNRNKNISKERLRRLFNYIVKQKPPKKLRIKKRAVMYDLIYSRNNPPTFELLVKDKTTVHWSYLRFLENLIRQNFNFEATEIIVKLTEIDKNQILSY